MAGLLGLVWVSLRWCARARDADRRLLLAGLVGAVIVAGYEADVLFTDDAGAEILSGLGLLLGVALMVSAALAEVETVPAPD